MSTNSPLPHVVIVGAGFGGLRVATSLSAAPLKVTVVDRNNYHLFQPLLYQVATAGISPEEIAYPMRAVLRHQKNASFKLAEVTAIDLQQKRISTSNGDIQYDYLVLAAGGETNTFGIESVAQNGLGLKSISDATAIRTHLLKMFELAINEKDPAKRKALLTFVVVGGGPTGVECAGAISELIRLVLTKDYPAFDLSEARVILLEATQRLLPALPDELANFTLTALAQKKVEVRFDSAVSRYNGEVVFLKDGNPIAAATLVWAAGIRAAALLQQVNTPKGSLGRALVNPDLQLPDHPEVFVIGDAAVLAGPDGSPYPMVAPVAMQQASCSAANIKRLVAGQPVVSFVYHDLGSMATIGRNQAVAVLNGIQFRGFPAWVIWLFVHIMQLIGFRNRLVVLINWAWDYFFYDRAVRLIQQDCNEV
jgi:NADH:ubiquinone reductase (H+-translocating)